MFGRELLKEHFYKNTCNETAINANFHFSHCNQSCYPIGTKQKKKKRKKQKKKKKKKHKKNKKQKTTTTTNKQTEQNTVVRFPAYRCYNYVKFG